jgi:hypothetical protein
MTPDLNHSITVHRANLREIWKSPEWKEANAIFHSFHPDNRCERCGRVGKIVPGHTSEDYRDMSSYIRKVRQNRCEALCPTCNWQESKGRKPCPECVKQKKERIRYIGQDQEMCFHCLPVEVQEKRKQRAAGFEGFIRKMRDQDNAFRREVYRERKGVA